MPKNIVPSPTAAVAVDRLNLHSTDARDADHSAATTSILASVGVWACHCFSEE